MAKKRQNQQEKFVCFYCKRSFDSEKTLIIHQKVKHFTCSICKRRLNGSNGLVVHYQQIHRRSIDRIPNALEGRCSTDIEVFGMSGIPEEHKSSSGSLSDVIQPTRRHITSNAISSEAVEYRIDDVSSGGNGGGGTTIAIGNNKSKKTSSLKISSTSISPEELRAINLYNKS